MFVLWGGLHGLFLASERRFQLFKDSSIGMVRQIATSLAVFVLITLTWIPFRSRDMTTVGSVFTGLFRFDGTNFLDLSAKVMALSALTITLRWHFLLRDSSLEEYIAGVNGLGKTAMVAACMIAIFLVSGGDERAFIYFQF